MRPELFDSGDFTAIAVRIARVGIRRPLLGEIFEEVNDMEVPAKSFFTTLGNSEVVMKFVASTIGSLASGLGEIASRADQAPEALNVIAEVALFIASGEDISIVRFRRSESIEDAVPAIEMYMTKTGRPKTMTIFRAARLSSVISHSFLHSGSERREGTRDLVHTEPREEFFLSIPFFETGLDLRYMFHKKIYIKSGHFQHEERDRRRALSLH